MEDEDKVLGVKDMHPAQVQELMDFCCYALNLADAISMEMDCPEVAEETASKVESLLEMLGANAVILQRSHGLSDSEPESD